MIRLAILSLIVATPAAAEMLPGYDRFELVAAHRARPVDATMWYPAAAATYPVAIGRGPIFEPVEAWMGPALAEGAHPLVLLSHGSGGNADALGWLSSSLVARGAIVLAVNHPGSTTGDSSPRRAIDIAARAADLSEALDAVLADRAFSGHVDTGRVSVVGFSLGGTTALNLAGLRFDGATQDRRCAIAAEAADCGFFLRGGVVFADAPGFAADARDKRIAHVVAVDPGFGGAVVEDSLHAVTSAVTLINLGEAHRLPAVDVGPRGNDLAARLPGARYQVVAPASHFTFLAPCEAGAARILAGEAEDPICTDPPGVDRRAVHAHLVDTIAAALELAR
jgi:predicted dienelactone hydrolase